MSTGKNSEITHEGACLLCEALLCGETYDDAWVVARDYVLQRVLPSESFGAIESLHMSALMMLHSHLCLEIGPDGRVRPLRLAGFPVARRNGKTFKALP